MADTTVEVVIKGTDDVGPAARDVTAHVDGLADSFDMLDHAIDFTTEVLANFVTDALYKLGDAIINIGKEMIGSNAQFEQYTTQFEVLLGSVEAAQERMADLAEFGKTTPFDLPGVVEADRILQGFGLHAEETAEKFGFSGEEIRRIAGDVAAGTGSSFQEMAMLIGRFSSGATGEALMRMAELGIGTRDQLRDMGIEFSKSGELLSPLPEAMEAVLTLMQDKYGGLMEAQSATFEGMMSNLRDWVGNALRTIGQPIFEVLKDKLSDLLTFLSSPAAQMALENFTDSIAGLVDFLVDMLMPGIEGAMERLPAFVEQVGLFVGGITGFLDLLLTGDYTGALGRVLGVHEDDPLIDKIFDLRDAVLDFGSMISDFVSKNIQLSDVLVGIGALIAVVVGPALLSVAQIVLPLVAAFAAVVGAAALLRSAWENDFLGIRTAVTAFWDESLQPAIEKIQFWFRDELPDILQKFALIWRKDLAPELEEIGGILLDLILPLFGGDLPDVVEITEDALDALTDGLRDGALAISRWAHDFRSASDDLREFISDVKTGVADFRASMDAIAQALDDSWKKYADPVIARIRKWWNAEFPDALADFIDIWEGDLLPAFEELADIWSEELQPALAEMAALLGAELPDDAITFKDVLSVLKDTLELITTVSAGARTVFRELVEVFGESVERLGRLIDAVQSAKQWLDDLAITVGDGVQRAFETVTDLWENQVLPALTAVWEFIDQHVIPIFEGLARVLDETLNLATTVIVGVWENVLLPALTSVWQFVIEHVAPIFRTVANILDGSLSVATSALSALWSDTLLPVLQTVFDFIDNNILPIFRIFAHVIEGTVGEALGLFVENILIPLRDSLGEVGDILDGIADGLQDMADNIALLDEKLPDWMRPGSPTPFEMGLRGIGDAMDQLSSAKLPSLSVALAGIQGGAAGQGSALSQFTSQEIYNLTINSNAPAESAVTDLAVMRALSGRKT